MWLCHGAQGDRARLRIRGVTSDPLVVRDPKKGVLRLGLVEGGSLMAARFVEHEPAAESRGHVAAALGGDGTSAIVAGFATADQPNEGAVVCACSGSA